MLLLGTRIHRCVLGVCCLENKFLASCASRTAGSLLKMAWLFLGVLMNLTTKEKKSFRALIITHFFTILNDNLYKFLLVFFLLEGKTLQENAKILSRVSLFFALPFLLLAPLAGSLSDRYQKKNIILATRLIEILCTTLGLYFFYIRSDVGGYIVLIFMACHTAIFGPAKLGILPEILPLDYLSKANGIMTAALYAGSILGSCLASLAPLLPDLTRNPSINGYVFSSFFCVLISVISMFVSLKISASNVKNKGQKISYVSFRELWETLQESRRVRNLIPCIFLLAFFLLVGAYVQVEIIPFVEFTLGYPKHYGVYLFPLVALGVGAGSYIAGGLSGRDIKLGYTPLAMVGIGAAFIGLYVFSFSLVALIVCLLALGFFGGVYQVPLHAYVQYAGPEHKRGQILSINSFLDFVGVLIASMIVGVLGSSLNLSPELSFFYIGCIVIGLGIWCLWFWREPVYRLLLAWLLKKQIIGCLKLEKFTDTTYFCAAASFREARRVLAMLPKTLQCSIVVMNCSQKNIWKARLIAYCLPTFVSAGKNVLSTKQLNVLETLSQRQPDLCIICIGGQEQSSELAKFLERRHFRLTHLNLSAIHIDKFNSLFFLSFDKSSI